jgi:Tfp pilus assembly ATPase PilU
MILNEMLRILVENDGADLFLSPGCPPMMRAQNRSSPCRIPRWILRIPRTTPTA